MIANTSQKKLSVTTYAGKDRNSQDLDIMNTISNKKVDEVITIPKNLDRPKDRNQTSSFKIHPNMPVPALSFALNKDPSKKVLGGASTTKKEFYEIANARSKENLMPIQ